MHTEKKVKWAIFFSGWGRTAGILKNLFKENHFPNAVVDTLVSTGQDSPIIKDGMQQGYHIINLNPDDFGSRIQWQSEVMSRLKEREIELIFLAGFKYRIHPVLLEAFPNRIINIHPSLLPSFKNTQHAIQDAMELGVMITGITTHIIDDKIDEGIIIYQYPINIEGLTFEDIDSKIIALCPMILEASVKKMMHLKKEGRI